MVEANGEGSDEEMDDDALLAELDGMDEESKGEPAAKKPNVNAKEVAEPDEDIYELESYYHDKGDMCSVFVMEHEIEYLN